MNFIQPRKYGYKSQFFLSISLVFFTSAFCYFSSHIIGYKSVALLQLVTVSIIAMIFDILPVVIAALLSALIWNFFFIPPLFTFHIDSTEDLLMFLMYFIIAVVHAVLTLKIREEEKKARDQEEKDNTIKLYNTLLNSLSHEIRTPLSTIIGAIDALKERRNDMTIGNQTELLNEIDIASIRLQRQVDNLLNMSRLESGTLKLNSDWCDTNELIHSVIQKRSGQQPQKVLFVPNEQLPLFKFDRGLIEEVLQNLVHNALLYTPDNAIVEISASQQGNHCVIRVADNGPGIPTHELQNIFDKFYRLPSSKTGGSGLGTVHCKGICTSP